MSFEKPLNLKIENNGKSSYLTNHEIEAETLSGLQRDILRLRKFLKEGTTTDSEKREVARCIRPILEGIIKAKYFEEISSMYWLGDIIGAIRKSSLTERIHRLNKFINELSELNDFSKRYHHSNNSALDDFINPDELRTYTEAVLNLVDEI